MDRHLKSLARVLCRDDEVALADLRLALEDWRPFYRQHGQAIGVDAKFLEKVWEDDPDPWEVLIDVASLHHWAAEADWREFHDEILADIRGLAPCRRLPVEWERLETVGPETPMNSFLQEIASVLERYGEVLVVLPKESDSLPLTLIAECDLSRTRELVSRTVEDDLLVIREHPEFGKDEQPRVVVHVNDVALRDKVSAATQTTTHNCIHCLGSGDCYCIRKGPGVSTNCARCGGSGKCHACKGTGKSTR